MNILESAVHFGSIFQNAAPVHWPTDTTAASRKVCPDPEQITITDNAIIPLKERVVDRFYDPLARLIQLVWPKKKS